MKRTLPIAAGFPLTTLVSVLLLAAVGCGGSSSSLIPSPVTPTPTGTPTASPTPNNNFGSLLDPTEFASSPQALPVEALAQPPVPAVLPAHFLATNLPAVAMQGTPGNLGSPGTCEAQSFGYGLGSFTAARSPTGEILYDPSLPTNSLSAAYLFALSEQNSHSGCAASHPTPFLAQLIAFGAPSRSLIPYMPDCEYIESIQDQSQFPENYPGMSQFQIGSYAVMEIQNAPLLSLQMIKQYLINSQIVAFSGLVLNNYTSPTFYNGEICETQGGGGHGQIVVGYDDTLGPCPSPSPTAASGLAQTGAPVPNATPTLGPPALGGLLVQNSFGTGWPAAGTAAPAPEPGQAYWSYQSFLDTQYFAAVAYPVDPSPPGGAILTASSGQAPVGSIERAFQWSPLASSGFPAGETYLIMLNHFAAPVLLQTVSISEPAPGKVTASAVYNTFIQNGYSYFLRFDGNEFLTGNYTVMLEGQLVNGTPVTYTGTISVGDAMPNTPTPATMQGNIRGTTSAYAVLTSGE